MLPFNMQEVCGLVGIPVPPNRTVFEVNCPSCGGKRLNIDLSKQVFNCCRCGNGGGMVRLFSLFTSVPESRAYSEILNALNHDISDRKKNLPDDLQPKELALADIDKRDRTYQMLLDQLILAPDHLENLKNRGLTEAEIRWLGYKSMPISGHELIAEQLQLAGCYLKGVPGFYKRNNKWTLKYQKRGIMIPVCDLEGKIQGITIRLDDANTAGKFRWMSTSGRENGCGAKAWAHYTGGWHEGNPDIFLTEGPMKADIFYLLTRKPAIAIPGVTAVDEAIKLLLQLKKRGLRRVRIALDMDYLDTQWVIGEGGTVSETVSQVYKDYKKLITKLVDKNFEYSRVIWLRKYKGIDDYLASRKRTTYT